jgi:DNA-binding MarR family transcriptional regulator
VNAIQPPSARLSQSEARRVLSFCLPRGLQAQLGNDGRLCFLILSPPRRAGEARRFEAPSYEEVLRLAALDGPLRPECIERQIAFISSFKGSTPPPTSTPPPVPAPRRLTLAHCRGLAEFRYQIRKFVSFSENAARHAGLEPAQHQLLLAIKGLPASRRPSLNVLADRMVIEPGACEALASSLVNRGFLRWQRDKRVEDGRLLGLTRTGQEIIERLTAQHRDQMMAVGPTFVQALGMILSHLDEGMAPLGEESDEGE